MHTSTHLKLYESLVLLALHDEKGTTQGWYLDYTIAVAVMLPTMMAAISSSTASSSSC